MFLVRVAPMGIGHPFTDPGAGNSLNPQDDRSDHNASLDMVSTWVPWAAP